MSWFQFELWKRALLTPTETFVKERTSASFLEGIKQIALSGFLALIAFSLVDRIISALYFKSLTELLALWYVITIPLAAIFPVVFIVVSLILNVVLWAFAKLLGGKGTFTTQYFVFAIFTAPLAIIESAAYSLLFYGTHTTNLSHF